MNDLKQLRLYVWAYRQKEHLKRLFRYVIPLEIHLWRVAVRERQLLLKMRALHEHQYRTMRDPLVSIVIPTYNRSKILVERTLPSVFSQTYQNFEIIIVGDRCTDDTEERLTRLNDSRIRFYNLPQRGPYPEGRRDLWFVAGVPPANRGMEEARGEWIAHLDDDDVWKPYHLEVSLTVAYQKQLELVSGPALLENVSGGWRVWHGAMRGGPVHSSFVLRSYLKFFKYDLQSWRFRAGADRHLMMRMIYAGVRHYRLEIPTVMRPLRPGTTHHDYNAEDRDAL